MHNNIFNSHTLIFKLGNENNLSNIHFQEGIRNFIANFEDVDISTLLNMKENLIKFAAAVEKEKGTFVIVSSISFDEFLNIVPTLQEALDFVEMEEIERELNL